MLRWCYLASTCNSIIIEIYGDIIRVSHCFSRIDILFFIAAICYLRLEGIRLQYLQLLKVEYFSYTLEISGA